MNEKETPTAHEILDNEEMRALACLGALALGRLDLCVALMHNNFKIVDTENDPVKKMIDNMDDISKHQDKTY